MAYNTATFTRLDTNADGRATIVLTYTGNAGELPVQYLYPIDATVMPTADYMRGLAMQRLAILNNNRNFIIGATASIGTVLDTTTALPSAAASTFGLFMAASAPFTPGATPQDVFTITGSATRVVSVMRMALTTVQTTAGMNAWSVLKRSTANSGGTSATVAAIPIDSSYPAATAVIRQYTANPTAGTSLGALWTGRVASPVPASAPGDVSATLFRDASTTIQLLNATEVLSWNFGGAALPSGLSVQASVWWTEA